MFRKFAATTITTAAICFAAGTSFAEETAEDVIMQEARSCVAALGARVNVEDVQGARHVVTDYEPAAIGYALRIRSEYFTDEGAREYRVYCVARGDNEPLNLRVRHYRD